MKRIGEANAEAHRRILAAEPVLADVRLARDVLPRLGDRTILHAGPPITWERMCGPMRGAVAGAIVFEGWAKDLEAAMALAASGAIAFEPNHHHDAVGPMTGMTTRGMAVLVVENRAFGNRAFCTVNEGVGNVMRFGGNDAEVIERLRWIATTAGPALGAAIRKRGGIPLKGLIARGLAMGDEMHMRNAACTSLLLRELAGDLADTCEHDLGRILRFVAGNDMFFLNVAMALAKAAVAPAHGIAHSTVVTTMARNGTDFGIRVSGTGEQWFTGPANTPEGLFLGDFGPDDANPDIGDSAITETGGIGGFAMAAAPAIVRFVGGDVPFALRATRTMYEVTTGEHPVYQVPILGFRGTPTGIDVTKVVRTGILPQINTGMAGRVAGTGQVGAGLVTPPQECFPAALAALASALPS